MLDWIKFLVFSLSHGHTGESAAKSVSEVSIPGSWAKTQAMHSNQPYLDHWCRSRRSPKKLSKASYDVIP